MSLLERENIRPMDAEKTITEQKLEIIQKNKLLLTLNEEAEKQNSLIASLKAENLTLKENLKQSRNDAEEAAANVEYYKDRYEMECRNYKYRDRCSHCNYKDNEESRKRYDEQYSEYKKLTDEQEKIISGRVSRIVKKKTRAERFFMWFSGGCYVFPFLYAVLSTVITVLKSDLLRNGLLDVFHWTGDRICGAFARIKDTVIGVSGLADGIENDVWRGIIKVLIIILVIGIILAAVFLIGKLFIKLIRVMADNYELFFGRIFWSIELAMIALIVHLGKDVPEIENGVVLWWIFIITTLAVLAVEYFYWLDREVHS